MDVFDQSNLTRTQLAFWLGQELNPDTPLFHQAVVYIVPKGIDPAAFDAAFARLIACSDALRTVIAVENGVPRQRALDRLDFTLDYLDFSAEADPLAAFRKWSDARSHTPFDLGARLFDSALAKLGDEKYAWYFCQHHIICDMFSFFIACQYMSMLYEKAVDGTLDEAAPFPTFAAYVEEEFANRGALGDPGQRAYWETRLAKDADPIPFYGKTVQRVPGTVVREVVDLGEKLSRQIRELAAKFTPSAKSGNAAQFNIFAAILLAYLHRICGVRRPSLGMPFHNRRSEARKQTIGVFMSVLPIAVDIEDGDTLNSLIEKVGAEASADLRNSPYFIHNLMHTQAHDILVNGLFVAFPQFAGAPCEIVWPMFENVLDPLVMNFYEHPMTGHFGNVFVFNAAIFDEEMRTLMVADYDRVAHALLDRPDTPIRDIDLLSDADRQRLLIEWNATDAPYPGDRPVHALVEAQAARTPDAVAVSFRGQTLTYRELDQRADRLAHWLREQGVTPGAMVGLCVERSLDMAVGVLGILKSGAAYVPLDPLYPKDRLAFMLEDAHIHVLLTQQSLRDSLPLNGCRAVCLDTDWPAIAAPCADNPPQTNGPSDAAYMIYTSGSTGRPKGVEMPHRALVNLVHWQVGQSSMTNGAKTLQFAPLSFDVSFQEMFCTWAAGGTLVLVDDAVRRDPAALLETIAAHGIERLFVPYVALQLLAQAAADSGLFPACLKEVITAGEQLRVTAPIRTFFARIAPCALVNQYGPTESHVVTSYTLDGAPDEWPLLPPIGRPIHNTSLYVLDSARRPVTIGVAGELYIGGAGLARGYHGRPELTRERFVANPFSEREGDRLYRTGDLVRYRSNGQIEFIGRIDDQVKVHGYRIELGEVESVLESHPQVRSAAADVRRNGKTDVRLAAYIVANGPQPPTIAELRGYLAQRVPRYMVPSSFTFVERLPLTPSGKVDRAALPEPAEQHAESHDAQDDPRTDIERRLADVWCKVLHVDDVGIHDNFFDLGGDSIGTIQLSSVAREAGLSVAPNQVFEYPTIAALAAAVAPETISAGSTSPLDTFDFSEMGTMIPIKPTGSRPPFFCVPGGGGVVFPFYNLIPFLDPEQPLYGLQDPSLDERGRIIDTVEELAAFHFAQMREIQPHGPYYIGGWSYGGIVAFEIAQMALRADEPVGMVAILDVLSPELMNARGGLRDRLARIRPRLAVLFRTFRGSFPYVRDGLYLLFNHTRTNGEGRGPALRDYFSWAWTDSLLQSFVKQAPIAQVAGANASLLKFKQPATRRVLHLLRINIQAIKKYDPKPYPGVLDVFRSRDDWADLKLDTFEDLGWGKLAEMGVLVHRLEGSHVTLMRKPYVDAFAKLLDARLRETQPPAAAPKRAARAEVESWYGEDGRRAPLAPATDGAARVTDVRAEVASAIE